MRAWGAGVELPATDHAAATHLAIPMSPVLTRAQAEEVVAAVRGRDDLIFLSRTLRVPRGRLVGLDATWDPPGTQEASWWFERDVIAISGEASRCRPHPHDSEATSGFDRQCTPR